MSDQKRGISMLVMVALALALTACRGPDTVPNSPTSAAEPLAMLEGTEWLLTSLYGNGRVEGSNVTLDFFPDNYLQGETGCNSYGDHYVTSGSSFDLPEIHRTSFDCDVPDSVMQQERAYFGALESIAAYRATAERLEFDDATGEVILVFARKLPPAVDPALEDTKWILELLHGEKPLQGSHITLNLGQEGFDGFAGCNSYGGEYEAASKGVLVTGLVWQTEMECESRALTDQEQAYVEALRNSAAYRVTDDRLEIDNAAGETALAFVQKETLAMNPDDLMATAWQLSSLNGDGLVEGSTITLVFHNDYRASGHAGCRDYVATYEASSRDLSFYFFSMIEAGCSMEEALVEQEGKYTTLLGWASGYRLQEGQLEIRTERGEVFVFEPLPDTADASLEGTAWMLSAFVAEKDVEGMAAPLPMVAEPLPGTQVTSSFEDGIVGGSASCNSYGAPFVVDGSALHVETPEATAMECLDPPGIMEQEQTYLDILEGVATYRIHYSQLWLETADGRALVFAEQARGYGLTDLVADLRGAGLAVQVTPEMVDHGFAIQGQRVLVDGIPVFVYEFADATAADIAFAGVSADEYSLTVTRSEGEVTVETHGDWIETPHLYKGGRLIVLIGDHPRVLDALDTAMGLQTRAPEERDCSLSNAFPPEEAELIWPTLRQVQPDHAAPGDQVEIRGTGGFLYWNNECGEFRNESARDFQLFFDGQPVGSITCYAHTCLASLKLPPDALPGIHTLSVEGGSSIDLEIAGDPPSPQSSQMEDPELAGR
jgi:heat shock protein HslJ